MGKLVCGDTQMLGGKPHICSSEPGHKTNIHICCCGTVLLKRNRQSRNLTETRGRSTTRQPLAAFFIFSSVRYSCRLAWLLLFLFY
jgi:hypothetical protein